MVLLQLALLATVAEAGNSDVCSLVNCDTIRPSRRLEGSDSTPTPAHVAIVAPVDNLFVLRDNETDDFSGFAVDLISKFQSETVAAGGSFSYSLRLPENGTFDGGFREVAEAETAHMFLSGYKITSERLRGAQFTVPFAKSGSVLIRERYPVVNKLLTFSSLSDLKTLGQGVCVEQGTSSFALVESFYDGTGIAAEVLNYASNITEWRIALRSGRCAAVLVDELVARATLCDKCEFITLGEPFWDRSVAIGVANGLDTLVRDLNYFIVKARNSGYIESLFAKYNLHCTDDACAGTGDLHGRHFNIITIEDPPFVRVTRNSSAGKGDEYSGYVPDMIQLIASRANFTYTLSTPTDGAYGTGVKLVLNNSHDSDIYWAGYFVTASRLADADFTVPFLDTGLRLVTRSTHLTVDSSKGLTAPFTTDLWISLVSLIVGVGVAFWLLESVPPPAGERAASSQMEAPHGVNVQGAWVNVPFSIYLALVRYFARVILIIPHPPYHTHYTTLTIPYSLYHTHHTILIIPHPPYHTHYTTLTIPYSPYYTHHTHHTILPILTTPTIPYSLYHTHHTILPILTTPTIPYSPYSPHHAYHSLQKVGLTGLKTHEPVTKGGQALGCAFSFLLMSINRLIAY
jgi:ABC-type amino acid transport substrate-binding protein